MEHLDRAVSIVALVAATLPIAGFIVAAVTLGFVVCKRRFNPTR